jgi:FkbM family methyltransferase
MTELIATNRYGTYSVPSASKHRPAARAILAGDVWEPETIELVARLCGDGDIITAGTYFGDFLPAFSRAVAPNALVHAFEPVAENHRHAARTVELNGLDNVLLYKMALSNQPGRLRMKTVGGRALGGNSQVAENGDEVVLAVRFSEVCSRDRKVTVIQLDVEGHEREALEGGMFIIAKWLPALILEEWKGINWAESGWFEENLAPLGYVQTGRVHENVVLEVP